MIDGLFRGSLGTVWALRALGHRGPVIAQTKREHEATLACALGASETVKPGAQSTEALLRTGAIAHKPIVGPQVYAGGGFPVVFDCVGSRESLDQGLRFVAPRGNIIVLGCAGELKNVDLTFLWAREIHLSGYIGYGLETWRESRFHTFAITQQLMVESQAPLTQLVSHRYGLSQYKEGFNAAMHRRKSGAFKVVLGPQIPLSS